MLLSLSNNVQVLKIVALVQDSNLIIGKVHGFLMLYASYHLHFCQLMSEIGSHPNFMSLHCIMYTLFNFAAANSSVEQLLLSFILTCTNHLTSVLFLFSAGRQMASVYFVGVSF